LHPRYNASLRVKFVVLICNYGILCENVKDYYHRTIITGFENGTVRHITNNDLVKSRKILELGTAS